MTKFHFYLRNVAMIIACLAVSTMFSGCEPEEPNGGGDDPIVGELTELVFPITQNTTLKDLGLDIDYVCNVSGAGEIKNNATLTIEPGVTIQFTKSGGAIEVKQGGCIKAIGTDTKHIKFIGVGTQKGSWDYIRISSNAANEFVYCDFINGGKRTGGAGVVELWDDGSELNMSHCKISGGLAYGLYSTYLPGVIPTFKNNVIEGCVAPVYLNHIRQAVDFDMTSTYANNTNNYVTIKDFALPAQTNLTVGRTGVPYFIETYGEMLGNLTITEGVTFYMDADAGISIVNNAAASLTVNGTAANPVTFTRLPGSSYYWASSGAMGIQLGKGNHTINHCIIEYGAGRSGVGAISMSGETSLTISNTVIRNSNHYGFYVSRGHTNVSVNHTNVTFASNADGNVYWHDGVVYTQIP
ncbi:MAG: hypothetical protein LBT04_07230 [Prevotellaceae bacterium]|jgi:hypothetical protein|nr:hypothetical protein [Prevotellaceae bacterium]